MSSVILPSTLRLLQPKVVEKTVNRPAHPL